MAVKVLPPVFVGDPERLAPFIVEYGDGKDQIARELDVVLNWSPN